MTVGHTRDPLGNVVFFRAGAFDYPSLRRDPALTHQLKDEVGGERLGLAGDLELHVGLQRPPRREIGDAPRRDQRSLWAPDSDQDSRGLRFVSLNRRTICRTLASARGEAGQRLPFGLQIPIRTPGVRFVSLNRTICRTLASARAGRGPPRSGPAAPRCGPRPARDATLAPLPDPNADAPPNNAPTSARAPIRRAHRKDPSHFALLASQLRVPPATTCPGHDPTPVQRRSYPRPTPRVNPPGHDRPRHPDRRRASITGHYTVPLLLWATSNSASRRPRSRSRWSRSRLLLVDQRGCLDSKPQPPASI